MINPTSSHVTRCIRCVVAGMALATVAGAQTQLPAGTKSRLRFVVEARQLGPVGYRDPIGVMSPDGEWLAFTSRGHLQLTHTAGGAITTLGPRAMVPAIAWLPDSRHVAVLENAGAGLAWSLVDIPSGTRRALWPRPFPKAASGADSVAVDPSRFRELAWSAGSGRLAGIIPQERGSLLWTGKPDGSDGRVERSATPLFSPAWSPNGKTLACLAISEGKRYLSLPCGSSAISAAAPEAYGPLAFSPDGTKLYFASPNARGTLDLWVRPLSGGAATRITSFARDTYAPSVSKDGRVVFGVQDFRTFIAVVPAAGGALTQLTSFQSETPSWSRDDRLIGITYGPWRQYVNDLRYPDIAQDLGVIRSDVETPAAAPFKVVRASSSEDQGMDWSPNGHWIVLHSHANGLDDVWIQPADGSAPAQAITMGGSETGWPRWSPNGGWIAYSTEIEEANRTRSVLFTVGIDSATGRVTREARRIPIDGLSGDVDQVGWSPTSDSLVFLVADGFESRAIYVVARAGGAPRLVHRFTSDQQVSGVGVSPDFRWAVFAAPATDGHRQLFRVPLAGGAPTQLTFDATDKTQAAVSHDGTRIAFTVDSYTMQFWSIEP